MTKRVVCVMGRMLDQDDGLNVYADNLLTGMFRLDPESRYVVLLRTPKHQSVFEGFPNVEVKVVPARKKIWWDQVVVAREARRMGADIIFNPKFSLPLLARRPGVFVLHGADWYVNPRCYEWWDNVYIRVMLPVYSWKASRLLAISEKIREDLIHYARVDARKVAVTYAAPGPRFTSEADPAALREFATRYHLPAKFMLCVARAYHTGHDGLPPWPGGNVEGLARGYRAYRQRGGTLPLVVAGTEIERYLLSNGFARQDLLGMSFAGFIPYREIGLAYNLATFFVLTTLYESFAFPLVEALASGCPAIVPSTGACPEVAGGAARLVDPRDSEAIGAAMLELDRSPSTREQLRSAGLERVKAFTWEKTARLTLEVFDDITRSRTGSRPRPSSP